MKDGEKGGGGSIDENGEKTAMESNIAGVASSTSRGDQNDGGGDDDNDNDDDDDDDTSSGSYNSYDSYDSYDSNDSYDSADDSAGSYGSGDSDDSCGSDGSGIGGWYHSDDDGGEGAKREGAQGARGTRGSVGRGRTRGSKRGSNRAGKRGGRGRGGNRGNGGNAKGGKLSGVSSAAYTPLVQVVSRGILDPIRMQCQVIDAAVLGYFFRDVRILDHLWAMRQLLLMGDGQCMHELSSALFEGLLVPVDQYVSVFCSSFIPSFLLHVLMSTPVYVLTRITSHVGILYPNVYSIEPPLPLAPSPHSLLSGMGVQ